MLADAGDNASAIFGGDNSYYYDESGDFDLGLDEAGLTRAEDLEDGWLGFTVHWGEDGWSYVTYNKDGTRYDVGDLLSDGSRYTGANAEEQNAYLQRLAEELAESLAENDD